MQTVQPPKARPVNVTCMTVSHGRLQWRIFITLRLLRGPLGARSILILRAADVASLAEKFRSPWPVKRIRTSPRAEPRPRARRSHKLRAATMVDTFGRLARCFDVQR